MSDLYGIEYTGDTEWNEEAALKAIEQINTASTAYETGSVSDIKLNVNGEIIISPDQ